ncbi:HNH endonuclease [Bacillus sp. ISL-35]|uniref:HNH endonuclease n=1 Tax=Bacillus sp. ISL-35 TaxID=2819122 RepID=UPI001BE95370|nr:HNH endonuclease signature motif containing protein [Bacillus sp. ISL-35]MBT2679271.1 HNH endonuclease [Bacillus sp. ISL-35]MBT2703167.1 HNH endonuclease [Chryseobacterium sp. ISL-80]
MSLNKWINEIMIAFNNLGGKGTLEEIYNEVSKTKNIDLTSYTDWKSQIRKNLYLHSSDCDIFKGKQGGEEDLFYSVSGKGSGVWGIRNSITAQSIYPFKEGKEYKRSEIHDSLGGNRQRGISSSRENPMIFIFSGREGKAYGYEDGWQDESIYFYTGEGQVGNQEFKEGNKALRDHKENGKDVYLFEKNHNLGLYSFKGQLSLIDYHFGIGLDKKGESRRVIIFEFIKIDRVNIEIDNLESVIETNDIQELRDIATESSSLNSYRIQEKIHIVRRRSAAIKKYALVRANGICEACNTEAPFYTIKGKPYLEVHHLYRLSDGGMDHPENVAAVCPNCHKRVHFSHDRIEYNNALIKIINIKERNFMQ